MKHIIIGDPHGKDVWKQIDFEEYDKVVFLGDYVDSFTLPDLVIDQNLQDIIALKKDHPYKIILLLGNHDIQYLYYPEFRCSGYRDSMKRPLQALFTYNRELFQVAYQCKNHLFTHAGITNAWYLGFIKVPRGYKQGEHETLADILNKTSESGDYRLLHKVGFARAAMEASLGLTKAKLKRIC
jgi:predicted MPP superfamily phosphohydrolase